MLLIPPAALLGLLLASGIANAAQTYRWVDAQGVVHYSDTPQPGAEKVTLPTAPPPAARPADTAGYQSCAITEPAAEASLYAPDSVHVVVSLEPSLRDGDRLQVLMDGQPLASKSHASTSLEAPQPDRGAHALSAVVRDASGKMVCSSSAVTFYVQRPSLLSPQSPGKGH